MPLTSNRTESSRLNPRTRLGLRLDTSVTSATEPAEEFIVVWGPSSSHPQFVGRFKRRTAAPADNGGTIAADQRVWNLYGAHRAVKSCRTTLAFQRFLGVIFHSCWLSLLAVVARDDSPRRAHEHETVTQSRGKAMPRLNLPACAESGRLPSEAERKGIATPYPSSRR